MKKSIQALIMAAAMLAGPMVFASCEEILGEWSKPTPVVVTPTDPTPKNVVKATDLLKEAQKEGANVVFWYHYEGGLFYAVFKKVGDVYVYQEGGNCNKASTRGSVVETQLTTELLKLKGDGADLGFNVYSADDAGNKNDPIILCKVYSSTAEVKQKTNSPDNYLAVMAANIQNISMKTIMDDVKDLLIINTSFNPENNNKNLENVLLVTADDNTDQLLFKSLPEIEKNAAEQGISLEKAIGAEIDNLKQKVTEDWNNGISVIEQGETLTTTISLEGFAITRGLDAQGNKTFAAGDQVAIYYQNTSDVAKMAITTALTTTDISDDGKTAKFTVTLDDPKPSGKLRYVYPASMAETEITSVDSNENISTDFIDKQDGTLETLASKFDLAIYDGSLSSKALLPTTATLKNQLTIAELTIKDYAGTDITDKIKKLDIQLCGNGYALTRPDNAAGPIYVALYPTPGSNKENITVTATANDDTKYEKDFKFNFAANNIYPIAVETFKVVDVSTLTIPEGENSVEYTAKNGDMLTGTIANRVHISIAANANVALKNLTIDYEAPPGSNYPFHKSGITCIGNATIILEGTNKVKAFEGDFPGIRAATANDYTLTIKGDGSLEAIGQIGGAGIGGCNGENCGNIVIESGSITATGGNNAAGIGTGDYGTCGSITITNGVKEVIAKKGTSADCSIGKGNGNSSCGKVTILGVEYWNGSGYVNDVGRIYLQDPDLNIIP